MFERYGKIVPANFPRRLYNVDFEEVVVAKEIKLMEQFGFNQQEMKFLIRNKPTIVFYEEDHKKGKPGIITVHRLLCRKRGFSDEVLRSIIVRYPVILSKTEEEIEDYFKIMKSYGIK